jgi:hypothetical protein
MRKLVVFGGARDIENRGKTRNKICLRDIKLFDFRSRSWEEMKAKGDSIPGKQNLACCLTESPDPNLPDYFYIHGGYNNKKLFSDSLYRLDLNN